MRARVADERGAHQKTVAVVLDVAPIVVVMQARLNGVAFGQKILAKEVGDVNVLRALVKAIEAAVGIFFELMKVGGVELKLIIVECAENTRAEIIVRLDEAAKV